MKNRSNFIPKSAPIQPVRYVNIAGRWEAVFLDRKGNEYQIQMNTLPWSNEKAKTVSVLRQLPTHRQQIGRECKTIKEAVQILHKFLSEMSDEKMELIAQAREEYQKYSRQIEINKGNKDSLLSLLKEISQKINKAKEEQLEMYCMLQSRLLNILRREMGLTIEEIYLEAV
jgi:hypothetical protein